MNKEIKNDEVEKILDTYLNFDDFDSIRDFIKTTNSSLYGGKNEDGEMVNVMVEQGIEMSIRTYQVNKWIRLDEYNENVIKKLEKYDGRWE